MKRRVSMNGRLLRGVMATLMALILSLGLSGAVLFAGPEPASSTTDAAGKNPKFSGSRPSSSSVERWRNLSDEEKKLLRQRHERLKGMDAAQLKKIKERYLRFQTLPPEQQAKIRENWKKFSQLSDEQRSNLRQRFENWKNLSSQEKQQIRRRYQLWKGLTPEQREKLRQKRQEWQQLPPERRQELRQKYQERLQQRFQENSNSPQRGDLRERKEFFRKQWEQKTGQDGSSDTQRPSEDR